MKEITAFGLAACELRRQWHHMGVRDDSYESYRKILHWCKEQTSKGQFLCSHRNSWYFEFEEDAVLFSLVWG